MTRKFPDLKRQWNSASTLSFWGSPPYLHVARSRLRHHVCRTSIFEMADNAGRQDILQTPAALLDTRKTAQPQRLHCGWVPLRWPHRSARSHLRRQGSLTVLFSAYARPHETYRVGTVDPGDYEGSNTNILACRRRLAPVQCGYFSMLCRNYLSLLLSGTRGR